MIVGELIWGVYRLIMGKYYLRHCTKVGKMISVNGKPLIKTHGEIYLGDDVRIWSSVSRAKIFVEPGGVLKVGNNCRLNGCHISVVESITIGNNVRIAPEVYIIDGDFHDVADHFSKGKSKPVVIEDNVWLSYRCSILKGVTIGKGSVVATGAIVTHDVPSYSVVAGIPAKVIRTITNPEAVPQTDEISLQTVNS
jgi:maltose O-acetyltransferase